MTALDHEEIVRIDKAHHILPCETNQHRTPRNARMVHDCSHSFSYAPISAELLVQRDPVPESLEQSCRMTPQGNATAPPALLDPSPESAMESEMNRETWRKPGEFSEFLGMLQCVKKNFSGERAEGKSRGWAWLLFTSLISMAVSLHSLNKSCVSVTALNNLCWFVEIGITKLSLDWRMTGLVCLV